MIQQTEKVEQIKASIRWQISLMVVSIGALAAGPSVAQRADTPGVTATEIKIGQTMPYSGPASAWATIGRAKIAYFDMINEQGGIGGRRIRLIRLDDGYSPPKTWSNPKAGRAGRRRGRVQRPRHWRQISRSANI
jgi:ABC-type branched-subunit amino acid transport system substrate-binding protein